MNHFCFKLNAIHVGSLSLSQTWNSLAWTACPVRTWFFRNVVSSKYQHNSVRWIIHSGFIKPEFHGYLAIFPHIRRSTSPLHVSRACHIFSFLFLLPRFIFSLTSLLSDYFMVFLPVRRPFSPPFMQMLLFPAGLWHWGIHDNPCFWSLLWLSCSRCLISAWPPVGT